MPNSRSALKRVITDAAKRARNRKRKSYCKKLEKVLMTQLAESDAEGAKETLAKCFSALDKAAKVGTIHQNGVNRKKARLTARLNAS